MGNQTFFTKSKILEKAVNPNLQTDMRGYGTGIFIDHGIINGKHVVSEYGHLSDYNVKVGDKIKKGQVFAKSGNTGISTGPHLHITIREDKIPVDPKKYF